MVHFREYTGLSQLYKAAYAPIFATVNGSVTQVNFSVTVTAPVGQPVPNNTLSNIETFIEKDLPTLLKNDTGIDHVISNVTGGNIFMLMKFNEIETLFN